MGGPPCCHPAFVPHRSLRRCVPYLQLLSLALAAILGVAGGTWAIANSIGKVELSLTKDMSDMREQAARFEGFTAATLKHHGELLQELKSGQQELLKEVQQLKPTKG